MKNATLFDEMMVLNIRTVAGSVGKYSLGIVNSPHNGKRISFSKALAYELGLADTVTVMPHATARKLVIGRTLPFPNAVLGKLSGEGKKICYRASIVEMLTKTFDIDFTEHVSRTFGDIEFDKCNGVPVAIVTFPGEVTAESEAEETSA